MAGERKENSVLFRLKELKEMTADEPKAAPGRAAAAAPPKARATANFIDDADSLLADIRGTVDQEAAAEAHRIEEERRRADESARSQIMATQTAQRAEIDARIAAERARQRAAEEERESRARALDLADRRARGEIVDEPEPAPVIHAAPVAPVQVAQPHAPEQGGRGNTFYLVVVGLPVLCLTAVAIALILKPADAPQMPLAPAPPRNEVVTVAPPAQPMPAPAVAAAEPDEEDAADADGGVEDAEPNRVATTKRRGRKGTRKGGHTAAPAAKGDGADETGKPKEKLKLNLGGDGDLTF